MAAYWMPCQARYFSIQRPSRPSPTTGAVRRAGAPHDRAQAQQDLPRALQWFQEQRREDQRQVCQGASSFAVTGPGVWFKRRMCNGLETRNQIGEKGSSFEGDLI